MPLSEAKIRAAKPKDRIYKMYDSHGLFIQICPWGSKRWRFYYKVGGRNKTISLGIYPEVSLAEARKMRDEARKLLLEGKDPSHERKKRKAELELLFKDVVTKWLEFARKNRGWTKAHYDKVLIRVNKHIIPLLGSTPTAHITAKDVLSFIYRVEKRATSDVARRCFQYVRAALDYAQVMGYIDNNPADPVARGGFLPARRQTHYPAVLDPNSIGKILIALEQNTNRMHYPIRYALMIAPYVFVRPSELRTARWRDVDLQEGVWILKRSKTKQEHVIPLSRQVVSLFKEIEPLSKGVSWAGWVFPSMLNPRKHIGDLNSAFRRIVNKLGLKMTIHAWRAVARTLLHEKLGFSPDAIEHQLGHKVPDRLGEAYNRTKFLEERKRMMQEWADFLDALKEKTQV